MADKKLAERNRVARDAKKKNRPAAPAEEKKEPGNPRGGVNGYFRLGIGGLAVSALGVYHQREAIMVTLRKTPVPSEAGVPEPEPKPKPSRNLRLMDCQRLSLCIAWQVLQSWPVALCLTLLLLLAAIILPVIFLAMTQRPPSKKSSQGLRSHFCQL